MEVVGLEAPEGAGRASGVGRSVGADDDGRGRRVGKGLRWVVAAGVVVVVALGVIERFLLYTHTLPTNSDEALSGLMARQVWHGELPLFLWGQSFGGSPEILPVAVVTRLFSHSLLAERATTMGLGAVSAWLAYLVVRRLGGTAAGVAAGAVLWCWPVFFVQFSMTEYVYYEPIIALGLFACWCGQRGQEEPASPWWLLGVGLTSGIGWWVNPEYAVFAAPLTVLLLAGRARLVRPVAVTGVGTMIGAAPWLWFNARHHLVSLNAGVLDTHSTYGARLDQLAHLGLPVALGLRRPDGTWLGGWAPGAYIAVIAVIAVMAVLTLWRWLGRRIDAPFDVAGVVAYPFVYALSPAVGGPFVPRYFFFAWPFVALATGRFVASLPAGQLRRQGGGTPKVAQHRQLRSHPRGPASAGRWRLALPVVFSAAIALSVAGAVTAGRLPTASGALPGMTASQTDITVVTKALESHGVHRLFSSYWQAYLVDQVADGQVYATPAAEAIARYQPWDRLVRNSADPAWLFAPGIMKERTFLSWLASNHVAATEFDAAGFHVYLPSRKLLPEQLPAAVSNNAIDGL